MVDRLNAAVFAGLPIAISAYFWANRLLPAQAAERAAQEQSAMFAVWGIVLAAACIMAARLVWPSLLAVAGLAAALLGALDMTGEFPARLVDTILLASGIAFSAAAIRSFRLLRIHPGA